MEVRADRARTPFQMSLRLLFYCLRIAASVCLFFFLVFFVTAARGSCGARLVVGVRGTVAVPAFVCSCGRLVVCRWSCVRWPLWVLALVFGPAPPLPFAPSLPPFLSPPLPPLPLSSPLSSSLSASRCSRGRRLRSPLRSIGPG